MSLSGSMFDMMVRVSSVYPFLKQGAQADVKLQLLPYLVCAKSEYADLI